MGALRRNKQPTERQKSRGNSTTHRAAVRQEWRKLVSTWTAERDGNPPVQEVRHQPAGEGTDPVARGQSDGLPDYGDTPTSLQALLTPSFMPPTPRRWSLPVSPDLRSIKSIFT